MSQKWNRLHAQEEVNVKLYQKEHNAQVTKRDFYDLRIHMHNEPDVLKTRCACE